jgi:hypothetical protein
MPLGGVALKPRFVAKLMFDAGWSDAVNLMKMVAVADAESNLYTEAYHANDNGTTDWGYLQLNDGGVEGQELEAFKVMAFDPVTATAHARLMFERRKFQPWVAYTSGAWKEHVARASVGVANFLRERYGVPLL